MGLLESFLLQILCSFHKSVRRAVVLMSGGSQVTDPAPIERTAISMLQCQSQPTMQLSNIKLALLPGSLTTPLLASRPRSRYPSNTVPVVCHKVGQRKAAAQPRPSCSLCRDCWQLASEVARIGAMAAVGGPLHNSELQPAQSTEPEPSNAARLNAVLAGGQADSWKGRTGPVTEYCLHNDMPRTTQRPGSDCMLCQCGDATSILHYESYIIELQPLHSV